MIRPPRCALAVIGGTICLSQAPSAVAQTSVQGVPANRPDQNPAGVRARQAPPPRFVQARNPDAPITPFVLRDVVIDGSTLPPAALQAAYQPFVGQQIDNRALSAIVDALAAAYANSDIALYSVLTPNQRFANGTLRIITVEGYVAGVEVRGKLRRQRASLLRRYLAKLQAERPLRKSTLQRYISLIRDLPGFYPDLEFKTGAQQGAVQLQIVARERPVQVAFGLNDRGTALLGRTQAQADVLLNGVVGGGDQLRLTTVLPAHVGRFQYYAGSYATPINANGTALSVNASYLRTRPKRVPLKGDATSFGFQLSHPVVRSYNRNLFLTAGIDGLNSNNALLGFTLSNDRVRTLRLAASFSTNSDRNQLTLSTTGSFGLDILGARVDPDLSRKRFRKLNAKATDALLVGKQFVLRLNAFGQVTGDRLPSSEQIALGGDEFGRAYEAALIAGDYGYAASAEFAWRPDGLPKPLAGSELYLLSDAGRTYYRGRFGDPTTSAHLESVGAGARAQILNRSVVQVEAVRGLSNPVFYEDRKKTRVLFSINTLF